MNIQQSVAELFETKVKWRAFQEYVFSYLVTPCGILSRVYECSYSKTDGLHFIHSEASQLASLASCIVCPGPIGASPGAGGGTVVCHTLRAFPKLHPAFLGILALILYPYLPFSTLYLV